MVVALLDHRVNGAALDEHLGDQILAPLAIANILAVSPAGSTRSVWDIAGPGTFFWQEPIAGPGTCYT